MSSGFADAKFKQSAVAFRAKQSGHNNEGPLDGAWWYVSVERMKKKRALNFRIMYEASKWLTGICEAAEEKRGM